MKCLVCGKDFESAECPRCRFPNVQILGDQKKELEKLKPMIDAFRASFLQSVQVHVIAYRWKDQDGVVTLDRKDRIPLGSGEDLSRGETWITEKFARIADQNHISVTVSITTRGESREESVSVPNPQRAELQQLGARLDQDCNLQLSLRNDTDVPVWSEPMALFD